HDGDHGRRQGGLIRDWGLGLGWSANRSALVVISSPSPPVPQSPSPQSPSAAPALSPESTSTKRRAPSSVSSSSSSRTRGRASASGRWTSSCGRAAGVRAVGTIRSAVAGLDPSLAIVKLWYLPARAATPLEMIVLRDE